MKVVVDVCNVCGLDWIVENLPGHPQIGPNVVPFDPRRKRPI